MKIILRDPQRLGEGLGRGGDPHCSSELGVGEWGKHPNPTDGAQCGNVRLSPFTLQRPVSTLIFYLGPAKEKTPALMKLIGGELLLL